MFTSIALLRRTAGHKTHHRRSRRLRLKKILYKIGFGNGARSGRCAVQVVATSLKDVLVLQPRVFGDERGFFFESYNEATFSSLGLPTRFHAG